PRPVDRAAGPHPAPRLREATGGGASGQAQHRARAADDCHSPGYRSPIRSRRRRDVRVRGGGMVTGTPENIDDYIAGFPPEKRTILEEIRTTIRNAAPEAKGVISYRMPTFTQGGVLVHFAAF